MDNRKLEILIEGCTSGDRKCQDELVGYYAPVLMGVCLRYCGETELAKDALQETFINIFRYLKGYSGKGSFEGWVRKIAVNCSYRLLNKFNKVYFEDGLEQHGAKFNIEIPEIYSQLGQEELLEFIRQLPQGQYLVFNMYVVEGYNHDEIAEILGIGASTSRSNLARARMNLKRMLKNEQYSTLRTGT